MSKKLRTALLFIVPIAVIVLLFFFRHMASKTIMNTGYVNGNTGSNLYNNGLFCENGDTLFFSNPDDGLRLYSMNRDGTDLSASPTTGPLPSMQMTTISIIAEATPTIRASFPFFMWIPTVSAVSHEKTASSSSLIMIRISMPA